MAIENFPNCYDLRGKGCFMHRDVKRAGKSCTVCICLSDTTQTPCPFFKTREQVLEEDPNYFGHMVSRNPKCHKLPKKDKEVLG